MDGLIRLRAAVPSPRRDSASIQLADAPRHSAETAPARFAHAKVSSPSLEPLALALAVLGRVELSVKGRSMRPWLPSGSRVVVRSPCPRERLTHRVVVARPAVPASGHLIAHRVIDEWESPTGRWVRMRGDSNNGCETVSRDDVVGVVTSRRVGRVNVPVGQLPARVEGGVSWLGRQLVMVPHRVRTLAARARG